MPHIRDAEQLRQFERYMRTLREDGLFLPKKRTVTGDARYLIVSYGGAGAEVLYEIRRTLKNALPEQEYRDCFRFLAVDTDRCTIEQREQVRHPDGIVEMVVRDRLEHSEFCWLDPMPAKALLQFAPPEVEKWLSPELKTEIMSEPFYLDGNGASANRQVGRLTLQPSATWQKLHHMIREHIGHLTRGNMDPLRVIVVTGISGGTGSGIVVDATYLIRDVVARFPIRLEERTKISGFILLPPAVNGNGNPTAMEKGHRNGYAAMKEINHFMTLKQRRERYEQDCCYGHRIYSDRNLFDACFLMDGTKDGMPAAKPMKGIRKMLASLVLDMATSRPAGAIDPSLGDALTMDSRPHTAAMLSSKSHQTAPRDADYIYKTLGYDAAEFPVAEIKTYLAHQIFSKVYRAYQDGGEVDVKEVKDFARTLRRAGGEWQIVVHKELNRYFTDPDYGPFFVLHLLYEAMPEIEKMKSGLFANRALLEEIRRYLLDLYHTYFTVFAEVLETLRSVLEEQYGMVCQGAYAGCMGTGSQEAYRPITMRAGDPLSNVIRAYLDNLVTNVRVLQLSDELLRIILGNRDLWARLDPNATPNGPAFDAQNQLRIFWEREVDRLLGANLEDLLVKVFSNDMNARYVPNNPASDRALQQAALGIYQFLFQNAGRLEPTAAWRQGGGLLHEDFVTGGYLLVPQGTPHLLAALNTVAQAHGAGVRVQESTAVDHISAYRISGGVPAWKFLWTERAERAYESMLGTPGLHREEGDGFMDWRKAPNLLPASTWLQIPGYENPREREQAVKARELFHKAREYGLTMAVPSIGAPMLEYSVRVLPPDLRPETALLRAWEREETAGRRRMQEGRLQVQAQRIARRIREENMGSRTTVEDIPQVLDRLANREALSGGFGGFVPDMPADWSEEMAVLTLRRRSQTMEALHGTLLVIEALRELLSGDRTP